MDSTNAVYLFQIYYNGSTGYEVFSNDFDDGVMSVDTHDNGTSFTITGLTPGTNYTVIVSAYTAAGEGEFSVPVTEFTSTASKYFQLAKEDKHHARINVSDMEQLHIQLLLFQ